MLTPMNNPHTVLAAIKRKGGTMEKRELLRLTSTLCPAKERSQALRDYLKATKLIESHYVLTAEGKKYLDRKAGGKP